MPSLNQDYWRIISLQELPSDGQHVWVCDRSRMRRATFEAPDRWQGEITAPLYWIPLQPGDVVPSMPGRDAAFSALYFGQTVWAFTTAATPFEAWFDAHASAWKDAEGNKVEGVRFWKTSLDHPQDRDPNWILDPQDELLDI